ncbi:MAG: recombinase family protein [Oscillospiraceae bacterium]|nr:recombinase family protein [Oscillospiraceae bacterium]
MKQLGKKQYVIYSRKSKFTGKGESIENQIEMCRQYIAMHFGQDEADNALVFEDEGFSGGNLERPQFKRMMAESHKTQFTAIVVYRLDRISRNIGDFAKLIEDLGQRNIDFISIREQFDTSSPMGRAMMYIASVFSQLERETIAERIRDNMHELAKTGRWLGGTTPTGYRSESESKITIDGKTHKSFRLVPIPEELSLVQLIFDKYLETGSLTKVDQFLLENRYTSKWGNDFTRFTIRNILSNPVYMIADDAAYRYFVDNKADLCSDKSEFDAQHGIMAYNRTHQQAGKSTKLRPVDEWIVTVGKHPGLIPGMTWIQVQGMLEGNRNKGYRHPRSNVALLSGLLICGDCGNYMRPKLTQRRNKDGELIYSYMCNTKERSTGSRCKMKNANGNTLDAKVIEEIKKLADDKEFFADFLGQTKKAIASGRDGYEAEAETLRQQLSENEATIKALLKSLANVSGTTAEKYITEQIEELGVTGEALTKRLGELENLMEHQKLASQEFEFFQQMISSLAANIDDASVEEKRRLLKAIVRKIVWDGENAHVYLFAADGDVDLPPVNGEIEPLSPDSKRNPDALPHPQENGSGRPF